jgi:hypothetical protein
VTGNAATLMARSGVNAPMMTGEGHAITHGAIISQSADEAKGLSAYRISLLVRFIAADGSGGVCSGDLTAID